MYNDLWNHAVAAYGRPGVEEACLRLQTLGADVCLLLCASWLQARQVAVEPERVRVLEAACRSWQQEVVTPLRRLRQQWKAAAQGDAQLAQMREQVKGLELQAERVLLERLEACAADWPDAGAGSSNDWLTRLAPDQAKGHGALETLRAVAQAIQDEDA